MTDVQVPDDALFVVGLEVRNVMGVRTVRMDFDASGELVLIGGENAQGKTSTLTALEMAIAGAGAAPEKALRSGAESGEARVTLVDRAGNPALVVKRIVTKAGTRLELLDADGSPVKRPQEKLDALLSAIGFDPLEFADLAKRDPVKAATSMRKLVGLDFFDLDERAAKLTEVRKQARREAEDAATRLDAAPGPHRDAPASEVSVAALTEELTAASAELDRRRDLRWALEGAQAAEREAVALVDSTTAEVARVEELLQRALGAQRKAREGLDEARATVLDAMGVVQEADREPAPDVAAITARIAEADVVNRKVRENAARAALEATREAKELARGDAQLDLDAVAEERRKRIASAKYPIDGLSFDEDGSTLLLGGVPFAQASDAERVRVSLAVGMALNPKLRALVIGRSGNDLDRKAVATLRDLAREHHFLILGERVGDGPEVSVVIEAGGVLEDRRAVGKVPANGADGLASPTSHGAAPSEPSDDAAGAQSAGKRGGRQPSLLPGGDAS